MTVKVRKIALLLGVPILVLGVVTSAAVCRTAASAQSAHAVAYGAGSIPMDGK
jgi:hypothetical protein